MPKAEPLRLTLSHEWINYTLTRVVLAELVAALDKPEWERKPGELDEAHQKGRLILEHIAEFDA